jgi:hypothetical protein
MSPVGFWIPQKTWIHCFSTQQGNLQHGRVRHLQQSNIVLKRCTTLAQTVRGQVIDLWDKSNWPQCQIPSAWICPSTNREYRIVWYNTGPSASTWTACRKWGMRWQRVRTRRVVATHTRTRTRHFVPVALPAPAHWKKSAPIPAPALVNSTRWVTRTRHHTRELHVNIKHSHTKINHSKLSTSYKLTLI